jgi:hypothetical protein
MSAGDAVSEQDRGASTCVIRRSGDPERSNEDDEGALVAGDLAAGRRRAREPAAAVGEEQADVACEGEGSRRR